MGPSAWSVLSNVCPCAAGNVEEAAACLGRKASLLSSAASVSGASASEVDLDGWISAEELAALAEGLLARGAGIVLITLGSNGCYGAVTADEGHLRQLLRAGCPANLTAVIGRRQLVPAFATQGEVNSVGAGDAFLAGFLAALCHFSGDDQVIPSLLDLLRAGCAAALYRVDSSLQQRTTWPTVAALLQSTESLHQLPVTNSSLRSLLAPGSMLDGGIMGCPRRAQESMDLGDVLDIQTFLTPELREAALAAVRSVSTNLTTITADGRTMQVESIGEAEATNTLFPLALWLATRMGSSSTCREGRRAPRLIVGLTGPGGVGKSTLAYVLGECVRALPAECFAMVDKPAVHVLGVDAYHLPTTAFAAQPGLAVRKGRPDTFTPKALLADLCNLREGQADVPLPIYDRGLHEPVAGAGGTVRGDLSPALIIVEGIHLLHRGDGWAPIRGALDLTIALRPASASLARERLIARKVQGGRAQHDAATHYDRVDLPNVRAHALACVDASLCLCFADRVAPPNKVRASDEMYRVEEVSSGVSDEEAAGLGLRREVLSLPAAPLLVVGLNPALQRTLCVPQLTLNAVARATALVQSVGGKGQHCVLAANAERSGSACICQVLGAVGAAGKFVAEQLMPAGQQKPSATPASDRELTYWCEGFSTRTCTTVLSAHDGSSTELIDPSEEVSASDAKQLRARLLQAVRDADASCRPGIAMCGSLPTGLPTSLYAEVAMAKPAGVLLLLDAYKGIAEALQTGRVDVLKINASELRALLLARSSSGGNEAPDAGVEGQSGCEGVLRDLRQLFNDRALLGGAPAETLVAVTDGASEAYLAIRGQGVDIVPGPGAVWRLHIPPLDSRGGCVNPIGAGDTASGVLLCALVEGCEPPQALARALAAASASCLSLRGADWQKEVAAELREEIVISQLETCEWNGSGTVASSSWAAVTE